MLLSDISVRRPVFAAVINLIVIAFGLASFSKVPLREYPDVDPPIVSIDTRYKGAAANVIETRITKLIEDRIAGIEGVKSISSSSTDGRSRISVEFTIQRDVDNAANDIRDRISGLLDNLPLDAEPPEVEKADANDDVIMWLNFEGQDMSMMDLTDYARRYLVDQFSVIDGVARVRVGGAQEKSMRIWLDRNALAARNLTVQDVERKLRVENVELPAGTIESKMRDFVVRVDRHFQKASDFESLILKRDPQSGTIRLKDVARIEVAPAERRSLLRGNGLPMVGIGIIKQSKANTINVARKASEKMREINKTLPPPHENKAKL